MYQPLEFVWFINTELEKEIHFKELVLETAKTFLRTWIKSFDD